MNRIFNLFILFLLIYPFWFRYEIVCIFFLILFFIFDLLCLLKRNIKFKKSDFIILIGPLFYFVPYFCRKNVFPLNDSLVNILFDFVLIFTLIVLKNILNKKKMHILLNTLLLVSVLYFFIPFLFRVWPFELMDFHIYSYFGDTYLNSIDRFYGTFDYCNASALFFNICIFICLFKKINKIMKNYVYLFILYINFLGLTFTFSKMVMISCVLIFILCFIYFLLYRKKKDLINIFLILISLFIPLLLMLNAYRKFLINLNIYLFICYVLVFYLMFVVLLKLFELVFLYSRKFFSFLFLLISCFLIYLFYNPIYVPLKINNVYKSNDFILTDFILDDNFYYNIELDLSIYGDSDVIFSLYKLYLDNLHPVEEVVATAEANDKIFFSFFSDSESEYYYIKVENLNDKSDLKINYLKLNNENYLINSLFVPYSYIHQFDLLKYDKESISHRLWYYEDSLKILKENGFFIGQGLNTFEFYASSFDKTYLENNPHSYLFQLWLDIGIFGLFYIVYIYIYGIYLIVYYRRDMSKFVWFCIFVLCIIVLPFDAVFSIDYLKMLFIMAFLFLDKTFGKNRNSS